MSALEARCLYTLVFFSVFFYFLRTEKLFAPPDAKEVGERRTLYKPIER